MNDTDLVQSSSQLDLDNMPPHGIYFRHNHSNSVKCTSEVSKRAGITWSQSSNLLELAIQLKLFSSSCVIIHEDTVHSHFGGSPTQFVSAVESIIKFIPDISTVNIAVVITPNTTQEFVRLLQRTSVRGIALDLNYWPIELVTPAIDALLADKMYWPEDIISKLPASPLISKPRVVSLRIRPTDRESLEIIESVKQNSHFDIEFCYNWDTFVDLISKRTDLILIHCKMLNVCGLTAAEIFDMIYSMSRYCTNKPIKIASVIDNDTTQERIKQMRKAGIFGIVPNSVFWGVDVGVASVVSILNGTAYWPDDIINQLPADIKKPKIIKDGIYLTARQQQILDLVCNRGLSNKKIASSLSITESTVKIHVSSILKTFGVRNRTQLALAARNQLNA